jgi:hypothetical protein
VPLTKDDIDAVSIVMRVNGDPAFLIFLTRGGLTKRLGSSDVADPSALLMTGSTDGPFDAFMAAMPEALLAGEGGVLEDAGTGGLRHDWRFELGGGPNSLIYDVSYDSGSASLPDEFADMVVVAERLTHAWYTAAVAEERGEPMAAAKAVAAPVPKKASPARSGPARSGSARPTAARSGKGSPSVPATRERIALAILLDLLAFNIPVTFLAWLIRGGGERVGPPGGWLMLFVIVEFVSLMIARRSLGYWLLGITAPQLEKPLVDTSWLARESKASLAFGIGLCGVGVAGLTSWAIYHVPVPFFGLPFPFWLSIPLTLLGSGGMIVGGALALRGDLRGVWLGGGICLLMLLAVVVGWGEWGPFVEAALSARAEQLGRAADPRLLDPARAIAPLLLVVIPALALAGAFETWKRLGGRAESGARRAAPKS